MKRMGWRGRIGCGEEEKANDKLQILKNNKRKWRRDPRDEGGAGRNFLERQNEGFQGQTERNEGKTKWRSCLVFIRNEVIVITDKWLSTKNRDANFWRLGIETTRKNREHGMDVSKVRVTLASAYIILGEWVRMNTIFVNLKQGWILLNFRKIPSKKKCCMTFLVKAAQAGRCLVRKEM